MQAPKRQRLERDEAINVLTDPIRVRWLILYFGVALECDSPILELFWPSVSPMLIILMKPEKLMEKFESALLPRYRKLVRPASVDYQYNAIEDVYGYHWRCTSQPHGHSLGGKYPRFTMDCATNIAGHIERLGSFEIDCAGFHIYNYQATFRKWVEDPPTLDDLFQKFKQFNATLLASSPAILHLQVQF